MSITRKTVSIVVTTYTNARLQDVVELIESIRCQTYREIEVILVIEGSRTMYDKLTSYLEENSILGVRVIFSRKHIGLSSARNLGIEASEGDIIAFVDDDVVLDPRWAKQMVKAYDDGTVIGVTGCSEPLFMGGTLKWLPEEFYWLIGCTSFAGLKTVTEVRNAWGMNMSFRRNVFSNGCRFEELYGLRAGGMEAWGQRPPEDVDLSLKARVGTGGRIIYDPTVRIKHKVHPNRFTLTLIAEKAFFTGHQRRLMKILYQDLDADLLTMEKSLLRRILVNTFPGILKNVMKKPVEAWHQFAITLIVLFMVFLGFYTYPQLIKKRRR